MHWKSELTRTCALLRTLANKTENEFLTLGSNLQIFLELNRQNASNAQSVTEMIETESGFNIDEFRTFFDGVYREMAGIDASFSEVTDSQADLIEHIERILLIKNVLEKSHHYLRKIALFIKMETARVEHAEFYAVVESFEDLADRILQNAQQIESAAQNTIQKALTDQDLSKRLKGFKSLMERHRLSSFELLQQIDTRIEQIRKTCQVVQELSGLILKDIGTVVGKLQFHDISRQQIEHVVETLEEIISKIPDQPQESSNELYSFYQWKIDNIEIQIAHLKNVITKTRDTANGISNSFASISNRIKKQAREIFQKLESDFSKIEMDVQFDKIVESSLQPAIEMLLAIQSNIRSRLPPDWEKEDAAVDLISVENRYTMEREREIHRAIFSSSSRNDAGVTAKQDSCEVPTGAGNEDVELF